MQITDPIADLLTRIRNASNCQTPFGGHSRFQPEEGDLQHSVGGRLC